MQLLRRGECVVHEGGSRWRTRREEQLTWQVPAPQPASISLTRVSFLRREKKTWFKADRLLLLEPSPLEMRMLIFVCYDNASEWREA